MKIAVLPGDGIGPEIVDQAVKVLKALDIGLEMQEAPIGGAGYEAAGDPLPAATLTLARGADAVPPGAGGGPPAGGCQHAGPGRGVWPARVPCGADSALAPGTTASWV